MALAGVGAGTVNTIVGSGSLITFPTLVALGFPPIVANVSNTVGLVPGSASGSFGYRRELVGQRTRMLRLGAAAALGGLTGGILLLALPASTFNRVVPLLILLACVLVVLQPRLSRALAARRHARGEHWPSIVTLVYLTAIYGGYFGAAQSVILIALLAIFVPDDLQRLNGLKNVLALVVNAVAALLFVVVAPVAWDAAALVAVGSIVGGQLGALVGRRLSPAILRGAIVVVGGVVAVRMLLP
ncbi:MAG: sulfite exporter TauE/SafE family protein [Chloroflexi bacterium]|nr:sulfite exporter TauE/SafE family protein [Chloroflexota bacterium]